MRRMVSRLAAVFACLAFAAVSVEAVAQYSYPPCQPGAPGCASAPPPEPYQGEVFRGAARGAARGAMIGAISGNAGRGAAMGAVFGGARRAAMRR